MKGVDILRQAPGSDELSSQEGLADRRRGLAPEFSQQGRIEGSVRCDQVQPTRGNDRYGAVLRRGKPRLGKRLQPGEDWRTGWSACPRPLTRPGRSLLHHALG